MAMGLAEAMKGQRRLYNIQLCYHGIVETPEEALTFRTTLDDFKAQINHMFDLGYTAVFPEKFFDWYKGRYVPATPIFCIVFDDALDGVKLAGDWLVQNKIPFGIPIITRRQQKKEPESGFLAWEIMRDYYRSGYLEIMHHTHNSHHLNLTQKNWSYTDPETGVTESGTYIDSAPVYEGPTFYDAGDNLYMLPGDTRQYFDYSIIETTFGFPLMGTDPQTGRPLTSWMKITPSKTMSVSALRLWAALHWPASGGYSLEIDVHINGQFHCSTTFEPTDYETRSQWKEREFTNLDLPVPFQIVAGQEIEIKLITKTRGDSAFRIYSLPWFPSEGDPGTGKFELYTDCIDMDIAAYKPWPCRPCIILSDGSGRKATDDEYKAYVGQDFEQVGVALNKYLNADWTFHRNPYNENDEILEVAVLGGTYPDGTIADTWLRFDAATSFVGEVLRFRYNRRYGDRYEALCDVYIGEGDQDAPDVPQHVANVQKVTRFQWTWADFKSKELGITPYNFEAGKTYWIRFKTLNRTSDKWGLMTILIDQPKPPEPYWSGGDAGGWVFPAPEEFNGSTWYKVAAAYGSDIYPDGNYVDANNDWFWKFRENNTGPGVAFIDLEERTSQPVPYPKTICYPFGAYYADSTTATDDYGFVVAKVEDIHPKLKELMIEYGVESGWSIWPSRMVTEAESVTREPSMKFNDYNLPRFMIYGNIPNEVVLNNIDAYIGRLSPDVKNKGYQWQTSLEFSLFQNGTLATSEMDYMAFDAYFFREGGIIEKGQINPLDRANAAARGITQTIILSNYHPSTNGPSPTVAEYVLTHQNEFIPQIVDIVTTENWDGITLNIEWVPSYLKAEALEFVKQLGVEMRALKKVFHMTCPAITGTEKWDYFDWMGWATHEEFVKHVDAIKIMTYTESGEFGLAAPHAPDEFYKLAYDYLRTIIKGNWRSRVLMGCNSYGHLWDYTAGYIDGDTGELMPDVSYVTAHEAIALALKFGAKIEFKDGEGYWQTLHPITKKVNRQCYFGSPETIQRAVDVADDWGGIGMWKADDGDAWEHFAIKPMTKIARNAKITPRPMRVRN